LLQYEIVTPVAAALMHRTAKYSITFKPKMLCAGYGSHHCRTKEQ